MPTTLSSDAAIVADQDLVHALQKTVPPTPYDTVCTEQADALVTLLQLLLKRNTTTARISVPAPRVAIPATLRPPRVPPTRRLPPMQPPRVRPTTLWAPCIPKPTQQSIPQPLQLEPHIIKPDPDDPVCHRYPLGSLQLNITTSNFLQPVLTPTAKFNSVIDPATGKVHEYWHLIRGPDRAIWKQGFANDLGCLAQGIAQRMPTGTNNIYFCRTSTTPADRTVTYARLVSSLRPTK